MFILIYVVLQIVKSPISDCEQLLSKIFIIPCHKLLSHADSLTQKWYFKNSLFYVGLSNDQYNMAVRTSVNTDSVFLKRQPNATRINAYNSNELKTWQANMNIDYITDAYVCAIYMIRYISNEEWMTSGKELVLMSKNSTDITQQVWGTSDKCLLRVEINT